MAGLVLSSCQKESFITSPDARLTIRADTLRFDTVFTSAGSVTKRFTLVNDNPQKLRISRIRLAGGTASAYALNINGQPIPEAAGIEMNANDSLYLFVRVSIDPTNAENPFIVRDSIQVDYNGNTRWVQLEAYGQNARYVSGGIMDMNTTWDARLPWVVLSSILVEPGVTFTIEKGARIYCRNSAAIVVQGTLLCQGDVAETERIIFRGDRLDEPYSSFPGSWPGIIFLEGSTGNRLRYTHILNAYQSIVAQGDADALPAKLVLEQCAVDNAYDIGILAINSSITATNCRITQCGNDGITGNGGSNIILSGGGKYHFEHNTIATFANFYQNHRQPVLV
ncbi:MAG TPA: hypothetical protein VK907_10820, partial [Phnomibacter sp.]|nr:hypothetical protein [Phnomibacter sp.]